MKTYITFLSISSLYYVFMVVVAVKMKVARWMQFHVVQPKPVVCLVLWPHTFTVLVHINNETLLFLLYFHFFFVTYFSTTFSKTYRLWKYRWPFYWIIFSSIQNVAFWWKRRLQREVPFVFHKYSAGVLTHWVIFFLIFNSTLTHLTIKLLTYFLHAWLGYMAQKKTLSQDKNLTKHQCSY